MFWLWLNLLLTTILNGVSPMSMGLPPYTSIGAGTVYEANSSSVTVTPNANTQIGDLVVIVLGAGALSGFNWPPAFSGDPWVALGVGYNGTDYESHLMWACIAPRNGSSGWANITLPATLYVAAQTHTFRIPTPACFDLDHVGRGEGFVYNSASGTPLDAPRIDQPYQQVIDLVGRSYFNGGTTTTVGDITNFTERFDTGGTTGQHGVVLNDRTAAIIGSVQNPSVTSALAAAKTGRFGTRAMIPIVGFQSPGRGRYGSHRVIF